jgi:hypothetical protein
LLRWTIEQTTTLETDSAIAEYLSRLPKLVDLNIDGKNAKKMPTLSAFKALQRLSVSGLDDERDTFSTIIANNPGLLDMSLNGPPTFGNQPVALLSDIFARVSPGQIMRLQSIQLSWFQTQIKPNMLAHLKSLESFRLFAHRPGRASWNEEEPPIYEDSSIWEPLRHSGIQLKHIEVDFVDSSCLDYLASSTGLETLRITSSNRYANESPELCAHPFFTKILLRHSKSIKTLSVIVPPESKWCFHPDYSSSLLHCGRLTSLKLSIASFHKVNTRNESSDVVSFRYVTLTSTFPT